MKQKMYMVLLAFAVTLFVSQSACAGMHGFFLDLASGSGEAEWDSDSDTWDVDSSSVAVGYVYDSDPDTNKVYNFRLNVGFARHDLEDDFDDTLESTGVFAETVFGFAFQKKETFRWWAGPLIRLGFYSGESDSDTEIDYAEFGLGVVTGMNFKAGNVTMSPSLGVRFSGYAGEGEFANGNTEDIEASATNIFFNLAVLF